MCRREVEERRGCHWCWCDTATGAASGRRMFTPAFVDILNDDRVLTLASSGSLDWRRTEGSSSWHVGAARGEWDWTNKTGHLLERRDGDSSRRRWKELLQE